MEKVSLQTTNEFCPQTLFVYGTNKENGDPNFGLFCWFSYCFDAELHVMCCIGGDKLTKDRIREEGKFSANLVTGSLLPLADWLGNNEGYTTDKSKISASVGRGAVLDVPVLNDSPWTFELEVKQTIPMDDSEVYICKIQNVLVAKELADKNTDMDEFIRKVTPVLTCGGQRYYKIDPDCLGRWGDWA